MKFHASVVEEIIKLCHNFGGHTEETKLRHHIDKLQLSPYVRQVNESKESIILVETSKYLQERQMRRIPAHDVIPMQLHQTVKEKIINIYKTYGGYNQELKLKQALSLLDLTPYESKTQGTNFLVLTQDYMKALQNKPNT
jgi:hypothetical protein